jgi:hypothetical protein
MFQMTNSVADLLAPRPKCLFIGPMKAENSPTRDRFDTVFDTIVKPAADAVGMDSADAIRDKPGMKLTGILGDIQQSHVI